MKTWQKSSPDCVIVSLRVAEGKCLVSVFPIKAHFSCSLVASSLSGALVKVISCGDKLIIIREGQDCVKHKLSLILNPARNWTIIRSTWHPQHPWSPSRSTPSWSYIICPRKLTYNIVLKVEISEGCGSSKWFSWNSLQPVSIQSQFLKYKEALVFSI